MAAFKPEAETRGVIWPQLIGAIYTAAARWPRCSPPTWKRELAQTDCWPLAITPALRFGIESRSCCTRKVRS